MTKPLRAPATLPREHISHPERVWIGSATHNTSDAFRARQHARMAAAQAKQARPA